MATSGEITLSVSDETMARLAHVKDSMTPKLTVSASVNFTINLGNYQSARFEQGVQGIDPTMPLEPQLALAAPALQAAVARLEDDIAKHLMDNGLIDAVRARKPPA